MDITTQDKIEDIEKILKKFEYVVMQYARNISDSADIIQEARIELHKKDWNKKYEDAYFYILLKGITLNYNNRRVNREYYYLLSETGYESVTRKNNKPYIDNSEIINQLELNISYLQYINPDFINEIKNRVKSKKKSDFNSDRAFIIYYLNVILGYNLSFIAKTIEVNEKTARRNRMEIENTIAEILEEQFGIDYINQIELKVKEKWEIIDGLIEKEDETDNKVIKKNIQGYRKKLEEENVCRIEFERLAFFIRRFGEYEAV
ncbi:hypothetical protein NSS82_19125 [Paenibacillus sp. FSL H7-0735]|uniref:hypothetical protein n=1 Tax=Paenibacillus sp. FSL H7-0735 TaxID=2954736 RepID=UPI0030FB9912